MLINANCNGIKFQDPVVSLVFFTLILFIFLFACANTYLIFVPILQNSKQFWEEILDQYDGLNEDGLHWLICLKTQFPLGATVSEGLGCVPLHTLGGHISLVQALKCHWTVTILS